jgi:uncharacterized protein YdaU (DUF1376 family)
MKNITVTVDDETYRRARVVAAERDTSVSALVKKFLSDLSARESEFERLRRLEKETRAKITNFSASNNVSRDELHERRRHFERLREQVPPTFSASDSLSRDELYDRNRKT